MAKVPDMEIIYSILNKFFQETEIGGWAEEDEIGTIYIHRKDGSLYAHLPMESWFELLEYKKEEERL